MTLKILGNWKYTPKACGNKSMVIEFKRLSGKDEMTTARLDQDEIPQARLGMAIVGIENPFKLELPSGKIRPMIAEDIYTIPELSDLYFELVVEYASHTNISDDVIKKPE